MFEWKDIDTMPKNELVLVWCSFSGHHLFEQTDEGDFYDENGNFDDSEMEYDLWCKIPLPGIEDIPNGNPGLIACYEKSKERLKYIKLGHTEKCSRRMADGDGLCSCLVKYPLKLMRNGEGEK